MVERVTLDELTAELRDLALERMRLGLAAFGLSPEDIEGPFATFLADAAGRQVAAEYAALANAAERSGSTQGISPKTH